MQDVWGLFSSLGAWNWLILAVVLLSLETVIPGVHFLWFGLAAAFIGFVALAIGMAWPWQVLAFVLVSVAVVFWVKRFVRPDVAISDLPDLNVRGQQYVGRSVVVEQAIENGRGKVRVGDTLWSAEGPDAPAGARVTVTGSKGTVLVVALMPA
ncbi:MAG TPA: NfeD family protein [Hyphomicrobiaceae bacterium]|jgi:membrane protein implicated in regulation of membrane protease activity|nr:NfeD family protein [Hyphomicrobiaceae bacterium]